MCGQAGVFTPVPVWARFHLAVSLSSVLEFGFPHPHTYQSEVVHVFSPNSLILCSKVIPFISSIFFFSARITVCEYCLLSLLEALDEREFFFFMTFFNGQTSVPSISCVLQYEISAVLIYLLYSVIQLLQDPCALVSAYIHQIQTLFPRSQNKHFSLIFQNPSSRLYHISPSEILACLCFFPLLVLLLLNCHPVQF